MGTDEVGLGTFGAHLLERYGPEVQGWIDEVPVLAARLTDRWGLVLGEVFAGGVSSVVLRCQWPDGTPAVLKLGPDRALLADQSEMLRAFASSNRVPAVLAVDADAGALVMEEIRPGTEAQDLSAVSSPRLWGELLTALHAVTPPAEWPLDLRGRCDEAFDRVGRKLSEPTVGGRVDQAMWRRAILRCQTLLNSRSRSVLLHGDLHPGNALYAGSSRGLVALDPKACMGDPCFDAVHYVVAGAGHEGVEVRCELAAAACELDGDRLYAWCRVVAPVRAIDHLVHHRSAEAIDELLALAG